MLPSYHVWNTSSPPRCVMLGELIFWSLINLVLDPFLCRSKTNSSESPYWLLGKEAKKIVSPTHIFVFVALRAREPKVSFYVVPRPFVAEHTYEEHFRNGTWYSFTKADAAPFENKWLEHFGPPPTRQQKKRWRQNVSHMSLINSLERTNPRALAGARSLRIAAQLYRSPERGSY